MKDTCQFILSKDTTEGKKYVTSEIDKTANIVKKLREEIYAIQFENNKKVNTLAKVHLKEIEDLRKENIAVNQKWKS